MFNCGRNQIEKACDYKCKIYVLDRISVALLNALLVARSCLTLCDPMNCQASLPTEFSRQEYWSGSPFPSPGDLPWPGYRTWISCIAGRFFTIWATRESPRILEWVAFPFFRGPPKPWDRTWVFCIVGRIFYHLSQKLAKWTERKLEDGPTVPKSCHTQAAYVRPQNSKWNYRACRVTELDSRGQLLGFKSEPCHLRALGEFWQIT